MFNANFVSSGFIKNAMEVNYWLQFQKETGFAKDAGTSKNRKLKISTNIGVYSARIWRE